MGSIGKEQQERFLNMDEVVEQPRDERGQWFVVHTLSGHENKVRDTILRQLRLSDRVPVYDAFIPTEKVVEVRRGKKCLRFRFSHWGSQELRSC